MTYEQYRAYKDEGKKCGKASHVYAWWDCIDLNEEQHRRLRKVENAVVLVCFMGGAACGIFIGLIF